ncbi:MAG: zinc ribbon domain-containing protein [Candidatus Obscuribacterales bacterium]|nr:zinc ribbon domain-containing protein [Steroidobacteraceae bacterium]
MPFYEYECSACKFYVEMLQKISDPQLKKCPSCKKQTMKRLVSAPAFRLKGAGWYETDFKTDQDKKRNLVESGDRDAPADTKADSKADPKADAKVEPKTDAKDAAKTRETDKETSSTRSSSGASKKKPAATAKTKVKSKAKPPAKKK